MPGATYQTSYEFIVGNFQSTDFPFTIAIYDETPGQPVATITVDGNGTYKPQNSSGGYVFPGTGWYSMYLTASNLGGEGQPGVNIETVILQKNAPQPPFTPTSSRYIRVIVRNFPIGNGGNGDGEDGDGDDDDQGGQGSGQNPVLPSSLGS